MKRNLIRRVHDVENMYFQMSVLYEFKKDIIESRNCSVLEIKR